MLIYATLAVLLAITQSALAVPVGSCDASNKLNQFIRDDRNACVYYRCMFQGSPYSRISGKIYCAQPFIVPRSYGVNPRYPSHSNPCVFYNPTVAARCERAVQQWSRWSSWGRCSKKCGVGIQRRTRECLGGYSCPGLIMEAQLCNLHPCFGEIIEKTYDVILNDDNAGSIVTSDPPADDATSTSSTVENETITSTAAGISEATVGSTLESSTSSVPNSATATTTTAETTANGVTISDSSTDADVTKGQLHGSQDDGTNGDMSNTRED